MILDQSDEPGRSLFAKVVPVPQRLLLRWLEDLTDVEFGIGMKLIGLTWGNDRTAAHCPPQVHAGFWRSLGRTISPEEIERALAHMVDMGVLHTLSPPSNSGVDEGLAYVINRQWPEPS